MADLDPLNLPKPARRRVAVREQLSHNLNGQRLGRKGRDTRDRIIAAAQTLLAEPRGMQLTLSAVAREASLGMTSLYNYFNDLTELLLAVMDPVMAQAEDSYMAQLREHWPDEELAGRSHKFIKSFHQFWEQNSRVLHLRNSLSDQKDRRMMLHRVRAAQPVISLLVEQMDHDPNIAGTTAYGMATVLYTGFERVVTVATDMELGEAMPGPFLPNVSHYLQSEARLIELGIRDYREAARAKELVLR